jgi:adenylosuccinate synthase
MNSIVIGLGFGDEGKGLVVDYISQLVKNPKEALVVRFSGGHQCGHTVVKEYGKHIFSNFGSGTLNGVPTYWSKNCTFEPIGTIKELEELKKLLGMRYSIELFIDLQCMITTPYDIAYNRAIELSRANPHGSCGVGFGATIERNLTPNKLFYSDIGYTKIVNLKMDAIKNYYENKISNFSSIAKDHFFNYLSEKNLDLFYGSIAKCKLEFETVTEYDIFKIYKDNIIFEGNQGILLDMDYGVFPNMTRASTTSKLALEMVHKNGLGPTKIFYVTRCYQTRHGAGYMTNEDLPSPDIKNNDETNVTNKWQGNFRISVLDLNLIIHALATDLAFANKIGFENEHIVMTCLDQLNKIPFTANGKLIVVDDFNELATYINIKKIIPSFSNIAKLNVDL